MQDSNRVDVVICGLGPTGLTLAHLLGRRGVSVVVLEREPRFYGNARAVYTDDECMRIFQGAGMADELAKDMLQDAIFQWVLPDGRVLNQLIQKERPYGWPANNLFYQPFLETSLADGLARYPTVSVRRGRELTRFAQDGDGVTVFHVPSQGAQYGGEATAPATAPGHPDGEESIRAAYLVACDGGRSAVRAQLGVGMTGKSFPNPWIVVDIREKDGQDCLRHLPYFNFVCDPHCPTVSCRQPKGHHRFEFMLMPGQTREYMEDPATVRQLLSRYVDVDKVEVLRSLVYTFNALVAERWREGRVFLAGDAAHMTPQFVGQGMNAGVRDAYNLAWKLAAVLQGRATGALLDSYETERRPHAKAMIDTSILMKNYVSVANPLLSLLRDLATRGARFTPGLRDYFSKARFKPRPRYQDGQYFGEPRRRHSGPEGEQIPQPTVIGRAGGRQLLDEVLGDGYGVIGFGVDPRALLSPAELDALAQLDARYLTLFPLGGRPQGFEVARSAPQGLPELEDFTGELTAWLRKSGERSGAVAIVRPDKFTYALVPGRDLSQTVRRLIAQLGIAITQRESVAA
ncbi:MAG: bifunctional 3-(3-hydroxy-phenyl)propionate/3-hydroxycinnamic acid hydroxylase [Halioglobus sp.]